MLTSLKRFARATHGIAATEFALIVPLMLVLVIGVVEYSNYSMINRRASLAAEFAADYLSRDNDSLLYLPERWIVEDIWMMVNPTSHNSTVPRGGVWANGFSRSFSSAAFIPDDPACIGQGCSYSVDVQWSFLFRDSVKNPVQLQCDVNIVGNSVPLTGNQLPVGMAGRAPVVVVDFVYPYKPLINNYFVGDQEFHVNAIRKTRDGTVLQHVRDGFVKQC